MKPTGILIALALAAQSPQPPTCATLTVGDKAVCNTAVVLTHVMDVAAVNHYCADTTGSVAGICSTGEPYAWNGGYKAGMWVDYVPGADSIGAATLNVNGVGIMSIKLYDGATDPGPRLKHGAAYRLTALPVPNGTALTWRMTYGDSR